MTEGSTPTREVPIRDGPFGATWQPTSEEGLRTALAEGAAAGLSLAPVGTGSSMHACRPAQASGRAPATWLSVQSLIPDGNTGIIEYVPGDGTLTAHAGTRWSALREAVAAGGHRLTPAIHGEATLGGVIAAGRSGLDRCAFGPMRHHVLGLRVMDGGGRMARSGGRLVKNVTGFDLHRVHTGARGTLGVILEASLRLMPVPEAEVLMESEAFGSPAEAARAALRVRSHPGIQPRTLFTMDARLFVGLGCRRAQMEAERLRVGELIQVSEEVGGGEAHERSLALGGSIPGLRILCRPSNCAEIVDLLPAFAGIEGAVRVEPDAALIDLSEAATNAVDGAFWAGPAESIRALGGVFDSRTAKAPLGPPTHGAWTERMVAAFDPSRVLEIPR